MTQVRELLCPNCGGPLPAATGQARIDCAYCGRPVLLETRPPNAPPTSQVPYAVVRQPPPAVTRAPFFVTLLVIGIGIGATVLIYTTINRQVEQQNDARRAVERQVQESQRSASEAQSSAFAEVERALEQVPAQIEAAERMQELARQMEEAARARAESAPAPSAPRRTRAKTPAAKPLPAAVDDAVLERALARLDVSHCPGPGFIVYTFRVDASGALKTVSSGPMRVSGGSYGCVRDVVDEAKKTARFPRTQNGSGPVQRRFELPD